jgi:hypothetical protein
MRITRADVAVGAAILALGALQVFLVRADDVYLAGDTIYLELAESIVEGQPYGFNDTPGTLLPPGLPSFLALLCVSVGCGHTTATRAMAIFATLGFLFSYALIRRIGGRGVAAAICLVLLSSPEIFSLTTRLVYSDPPYFAVMSLALWLALGLDDVRPTRDRVVRSGLFAASLAICLLVRSSAVSLLAGIVAWLVATRVLDRGSIRRRLISFAPALLLGVALQGAWMVWAASNEVSEWPLGGYPKSYLSQVLIVSGHEPELGLATWGDLARRVADNLRDNTVTVAQIFTRHWVLPAWGSPAVSGVLLLVLVGLGVSATRRAGALHDWGFAVYAAIVALWPWDVHARFLLPLLPLACWYLCRGAQELAEQARLRPRALGMAVIAASVPLAVIAGRTAARLGSVQALASVCFWIGLGGSAVWLVYRRELPFRRALAAPALSPSIAKGSLWLLVGGLVLVGAVEQLAVGRQNLEFEAEQSPMYPDMEAAKWLRQHTGSRAVLMARKVPVVHHHSDRRVVWFPPLSDPGILMAGIQRHGVRWLVVTERDRSYWLPKEADIFDSLLEAHPDAFRLEAGGPKWRVFAVDPDAYGERNASPVEAR